MAVVFPHNPEFCNKAEEIIYTYIKQNLPANYICYFNYYVKCREFDIAILVPDRGIVVLEIKGWQSKNILEVRDNNSIIYKKANGMESSLRSPLKQVNDYRNRLINRLKDEFEESILVVGVVCYPYISKEEFQKKRMDVVSAEHITILKDDLVVEEGMMAKIDAVFENFKNPAVARFADDKILEVRAIFEPNPQAAQFYDNTEADVEKLYQDDQNYSILQYLHSPMEESVQDNTISWLLQEWLKGTKIILITNSDETLEMGRNLLKIQLQNINLTEKLFDSKNDRFYNFEFYKVEDDLDQSFRIFNGQDFETHRGYLELIDKTTPFNLSQYLIEHAPVDKNIVVKAGAGSGKTYSMISRIWYLVYAHKITPEDLSDAIVLITFTNEATRVMKERFLKHIQNYYLLTRSGEAFQMIEEVEKLRIGTIHSLAKKIIQKFSIKLGLGAKANIITGIYDRNQFLEAALNNYLTKNPATFEIIQKNISMYNLQKRMRVFLGKMDNQNIDMLNDALDIGDCGYKEIDQLIKQVLQDTNERLQAYLKDNNLIRLSDLMLKVKYLAINRLLDFTDKKIKYVFVDEFQDTDNVQIELLKEFQKLLGFSFFAVGDVKQCIYRFRGAEDRAFDKLNDNKKTWGLSFSLNKNYRSDKTLLAKFESNFADWGKENILYYKEQEDRLVSYISINKNGDNDYYKKVPVAEEDFEKTFIDELKRYKSEVPEDEKIAILVRENVDVEAIRRMGLKNGCYIETDRGGGLYQSDSTLDFYKLVLALKHPKNPKYLYNLYTTSYINGSPPIADIYGKSKQQQLDYFYSLGSIENWQQYGKDLKKEPVLKVLRDIILDLKPWQKYATSIQTDNPACMENYYKRNLDQLFEMLTQRSNIDYLTVNKIEKFLQVMIFTRQSEESREEFQLEGGKDNRVYCMTVHKAKGLEFHTVFLPYAQRDMADIRKSGFADLIVDQEKVGIKLMLDEAYTSPSGKKLKYLKNNYYREEVEKEHKLNEETRILYVAMTRAKKNFVWFYNTDKEVEGKSWQNIIAGGDGSCEGIYI